MTGGRRPPQPTPPSWLDTLPVADWDNMEEGYYLIAASVRVSNTRYLNNIIVYATPSAGSVSLAVIYVGENVRRGLYYDEARDDFSYDYQWGDYSGTTIANHINSVLGSTFAGTNPIRVAEVEITKDDILGKLVPAEP